MPEKSRPRKGTLQFKPMSRSNRAYPTFNTPVKPSWETDSRVLGFGGYKAGMTRVLMRDDRDGSPTAGKEIAEAVTLIEVPPLRVFGVRAYGREGPQTDVLAENLSSALARRMHIPAGEKRDALADTDRINQETATDIRLLVHAQPQHAGIGKKTPEVFEVPLSGPIAEKIDEAETLLGQEISASDVFAEGQYVDVIGITKGKGTEGPVKRHGIKKLSHKAEKKRRKPGAHGPFQPRRTPWTVPMPGKTGFNRRTEYNKRLLAIAEPDDVNPGGGLKDYGEARSSCLVVKGSVPGPAKRFILLRHAMRKNENPGKPHLTYVLT